MIWAVYARELNFTDATASGSPLNQGQHTYRDTGSSAPSDDPKRALTRW